MKKVINESKNILSEMIGGMVKAFPQKIKQFVEGVLMSMAINDEKLVLCELEEELKELKNMKKV